MKNPAQIQREVKRERLLRLLTKLLPLERGTIWWVDEPLWIQSRHNYDRNSTRAEHPGLYLRKRHDFKDIFEPIPMALGGSSARPSRKKRLDVKGLSANEPERITRFDVLSPSILLLHRFAEWREDESEGMRIRLNRDKPRLNTEEQAQLESLLERVGNHGE